jgi:hypothetical protein
MILCGDCFVSQNLKRHCLQSSYIRLFHYFIL